MLGINHMTVNKHKRSVEFQSLAHELAYTNSAKMQQQIDLAHEVIVATLQMRDKDGQPTREAQAMAKTLGNTQSSKLMGTRADEKITEDRPIEEKEKLIKELLGIPGMSIQLPESSN